MFEVIKPKPLMDPRKIQTELVKVMEDTVQDGVTFMREYPPQTLTKTGYVRTMILQKSWWKKVYVLSDRIEGIIASSGPPYNKYVQGPEDTQSSMMAGAGWQNEEKLIARIAPAFKARLDKVFK
jgi:hypothetical protein